MQITIEGVKSIWNIVSQKYSLDCLFTRNLNQDPLENFFGNIRSYGARNVAPNILAFEGAYKALLINNFNSTHAVNANCEEDNNSCLQNFKTFIKEHDSVSDIPNENDDNIIHFNEEVLVNICNNNYVVDNDVGQRNYVCGWVLTKCLKKIKGCKTCKKTLVEIRDTNANEYTRSKEYNKNKKWLTYPSKELESYFAQIQNISVLFKKDVHKFKIKENIKMMADMLLQFPCDCPVHKSDLKIFFQNCSINVLIFSWCRSINRILAGKLTYDGVDEVKKAAQVYYNIHKTK